MLIRSQDKKTLMRFDTIAIRTKYIDKYRERKEVGKEIVVLSGGIASAVGAYSTEEKAIKVLDMIQNNFEDYIKNVVFQMPQDSEV